MEKRPILFLDSGIGGIPYCRHFHRRNPHQSIVYLADRLHFPYGKWEKEKLALIITGLVEKIIPIINPKMVVIACNTATLAALSELRKQFPLLHFVGTVPAVKPAALASKTGKIGVLGTELTVGESYIRELAAQYGNPEITGIAAPDLVALIEERLDSAAPEEKTEIVRRYLNRFRAEGVDAVVLGCTHFLLLEDEFRREAAPDIVVFESVEGISQRIESLVSAIKTADTAPESEPFQQEETSPAAENRLLLTGAAEPEPSWIVWAERLGFEISLLELL